MCVCSDMIMCVQVKVEGIVTITSNHSDFIKDGRITSKNIVETGGVIIKSDAGGGGRNRGDGYIKI